MILRFITSSYFALSGFREPNNTFFGLPNEPTRKRGATQDAPLSDLRLNYARSCTSGLEFQTSDKLNNAWIISTGQPTEIRAVDVERWGAKARGVGEVKGFYPELEAGCLR